VPYSKYIASVSFSPYISSTRSRTVSEGGGTSSSTYGYTIQEGHYSFSEYESFIDISGGYFSSFSSQSSTLSYGYTTASYLLVQTASSQTRYPANTNIIPNIPASTANDSYGYTLSAFGTFFTNSDGWSVSGVESYTDSSTAYQSTIVPNFDLPDFVEIYAPLTITTDIELRLTTTQQKTYYGPLSSSTTSYSEITTTNSLVEGLTKKVISLVSYFIVGQGNRTYTDNYDYYDRIQGQELLAIYTTSALSEQISSYGTVIHRTESFSATRSAEAIAYVIGDATSSGTESYTLTFDNITTANVLSTLTTLERLTRSTINFFTYGYIRSGTTTFNVTTANTQSNTSSFTFQASVAGEGGFASTASLTYLAHKATISQITSYREISGLSKADSFLVRVLGKSLTTITYVQGFEANNLFVEAPAPLTFNTFFGSTFDQVSKVGTFYTERATFASFATPSYTQAFKNYSPEGLSLFLLALIALNDTAEQGAYPSSISIYDGTFTSSRDRQSTTLLSVTVNQSSSSSGLNTSAYQTVTFNSGNNTNSSTTKTTSIVLSLVSQASSDIRLVRTYAENITSLFTLSYLPTMPLDGARVVYTSGLQGDASYNINRLMINAYTTNQSTFAESATSTFPASVSYLSNSSVGTANLITISKFYEFSGGGADNIAVSLQQFYAPPEN